MKQSLFEPVCLDVQADRFSRIKKLRWVFLSQLARQEALESRELERPTAKSGAFDREGVRMCLQWFVLGPKKGGRARCLPEPSLFSLIPKSCTALEC